MEKKRKQLKRKCVVTNGEKEGRKMSSQGGAGWKDVKQKSQTHVYNLG